MTATRRLPVQSIMDAALGEVPLRSLAAAYAPDVVMMGKGGVGVAALAEAQEGRDDGT